nr:centromere protein C isoform X2 [Geotrypetes seraphini]
MKTSVNQCLPSVEEVSKSFSPMLHVQSAREDQHGNSKETNFLPGASQNLEDEFIISEGHSIDFKSWIGIPKKHKQLKTVKLRPAGEEMSHAAEKDNSRKLNLKETPKESLVEQSKNQQSNKEIEEKLPIKPVSSQSCASDFNKLARNADGTMKNPLLDKSGVSAVAHEQNCNKTKWQAKAKMTPMEQVKTQQTEKEAEEKLQNENSSCSPCRSNLKLPHLEQQKSKMKGKKRRNYKDAVDLVSPKKRNMTDLNTEELCSEFQPIKDSTNIAKSVSSVENEPKNNAMENVYLSRSNRKSKPPSCWWLISHSESNLADVQHSEHSYQLPKQSLKKISKTDKPDYISTTKQKCKTHNACQKQLRLEETVDVVKESSSSKINGINLSGSLSLRGQNKMFGVYDKANTPEMSRCASNTIPSSTEEKLMRKQNSQHIILPQKGMTKQKPEWRKTILKTNNQKWSVPEEHSKSDLDSDQENDLKLSQKGVTEQKPERRKTIRKSNNQKWSEEHSKSDLDSDQENDLKLSQKGVTEQKPERRKLIRKMNNQKRSVPEEHSKSDLDSDQENNLKLSQKGVTEQKPERRKPIRKMNNQKWSVPEEHSKSDLDSDQENDLKLSQKKGTEQKPERRKTILKTNNQKWSVAEEHSKYDLDSDQENDLKLSHLKEKRTCRGSVFSLKEGNEPLSFKFRQSLASFRTAYDKTPVTVKGTSERQTKSDKTPKTNTCKSQRTPVKSSGYTVNDNSPPQAQLRASVAKGIIDCNPEEVTESCTRNENDVKERMKGTQKRIDPTSPLNVTWTVTHSRKECVELQEGIDCCAPSLNESLSIDNKELSYSCDSGPCVARTRRHRPIDAELVLKQHQLTSDSDSEDLETKRKQLSKKIVLPSNTPNVRRSKRTRVKPMEYWRGERVNYIQRPSGGFVVNDIIPAKEHIHKKISKQKNLIEKPDHDTSENVCSFPISSSSEPAAVINPGNEETTSMVCVKTAESCPYHCPADLIAISKCFNLPTFSSGTLILGPFVEKSLQFVCLDTIVYYIVCGKLLVTLHCTNYKLKSGDHFFIPPGNMYNIRNLLNEEAVLVYTQIKGEPFVPEN